MTIADKLKQIKQSTDAIKASASMSACTVRLQSNIKSSLTEDEIAQITAKGFTIS